MADQGVDRRSFDEKCYELALAFLVDEPEINTAENADDLAMMIQGEIEDWMEWAKQRAKAREK